MRTAEPTDCPCEANFHTRHHILLDCPRYNGHPLFQRDDRLMTVDDTVGTEEGIAVLASLSFIPATGAFT